MLLRLQIDLTMATRDEGEWAGMLWGATQQGQCIWGATCCIELVVWRVRRETRDSRCSDRSDQLFSTCFPDLKEILRCLSPPPSHTWLRPEFFPLRAQQDFYHHLLLNFNCQTLHGLWLKISLPKPVLLKFPETVASSVLLFAFPVLLQERRRPLQARQRKDDRNDDFTPAGRLSSQAGRRDCLSCKALFHMETDSRDLQEF